MLSAASEFTKARPKDDVHEEASVGSLTALTTRSLQSKLRRQAMRLRKARIGRRATYLQGEGNASKASCFCWRRVRRTAWRSSLALRGEIQGRKQASVSRAVSPGAQAEQRTVRGSAWRGDKRRQLAQEQRGAKGKELHSFSPSVSSSMTAKSNEPGMTSTLPFSR